MRRKLTVVATAVMAICICSTVGYAQESVLAEMYGYGVHLYFARQYQDAHTVFSTAIAQGSRDPRAYYFRGLTATRIGLSQEADGDFQLAAELEAKGRDRVYPVGRSLQRIQGHDRLVIEKYRREARLTAALEALRTRGQRYQNLQSAEDDVLRTPPAGTAPPPSPDAKIDPFADDAPGNFIPKTGDEGTPPPPAETDPFGGPAPEMGGETPDPFGGGSEAPGGADPFGGGTEAPGGADPFGGGTEAPGGADPFGGGTEAPGGADPFGGGGESDGSMGGDDPFGG